MRKTTISLALLLIATTALGDGLTRKEREIVREIDMAMPAMLDLLERSVNIPSATENLPGVREVGRLYAAELEKIGFETRWIDLPPEMRRSGHLHAERKGSRGKRLLLIGHLDTVLEGEGWSRQGDTARGNGVQDMKGGNLIIIAALRALERAGALADRRIIVAFTGDEEDPGSPLSTSRRDLVEAARRSDAALAFEASIGETATVARRGVTQWRLEVKGVTAHSSGIFGEETGAGAIFEAARILNAFHDQLKGEAYLTFNPSVIAGGTEATLDDDTSTGSATGKTNVIPQDVIAIGDLRFLSVEQREATKAKMQEIIGRNLPRTSARIAFTDVYPPMAPTEGNYALLAILDQASRDLGFGTVPALDPGSRGAGDVSFVSFIDGLDGLGARGRGSHTPREEMDLVSLPQLIKRTAILIYRLTRSK